MGVVGSRDNNHRLTRTLTHFSFHNRKALGAFKLRDITVLKSICCFTAVQVHDGSHVLSIVQRDVSILDRLAMVKI